MKKAPGPFRRFVEAYPECGMTYEALAAASREAAGFPEKEAELLKLALAMGSRLEGAVHSHARRALEASVGFALGIVVLDFAVSLTLVLALDGAFAVQ